MGPTIFLAIVGIGAAYTVVQAWLDWRRGAPLRREVQAQEVTCRIRLSRVKVNDAYGWSGQRAVMYLSVRDYAFEVSSSFPLDR